MEVTQQQAVTLQTMHDFTAQCLKDNSQPIVLLSLSIKNDLPSMAAHIMEGCPPEQVVQLLEAALIGMKQQANKTPSGIIKSVHNG